MTFAFEDADVINTNAGGKSKGENPFTAVVAQIAMKKGEKGKPVAKAFTVTSPDADSHKTDVNRVRRQLTEAGKDNNPTVSVQSRVTPTEGKPNTSVVTFWTIKRIVRTSKPTDAPTEAPTVKK